MKHCFPTFTIRPGARLFEKRLVLVKALHDANPLSDIANTRRVSAVMANGRLYDAPARSALLLEA